MSSAGASLTAKLVLTGDATGVVGAAESTVVALDQVKRAEMEAGAAATAASTAFDASAVALKGQTEAAAMYGAAAAASGEAQRAEVGRLMEKAAASESVIGKVRALSAAHTEYNGTVAQARALLAQGVMTEVQYGEAIAAATAKLALARTAQQGATAAIVTEAEAAKAIGAALGSMGSGLTNAASTARAAKTEIRGLSEFLGALGVQAGVAERQASLLRNGLRVIPSLFATAPLLTAAAAAAAGIGLIVGAEQSYEASIGRLNVTLQAHGIALALNSDRYLKLASDIASTGDVSSRTAREMEGVLVNAHINQSLWSSIAAMAEDYAQVLNTDVASATQKWAEDLSKPFDLAVQLTEQYGLFDQVMLQHIRDLELSGRTQEAQKIITDAWAARIKNAADQTSGWGRAWKVVAEGASDAWDAIGKGLFGESAGERLRQQIALDEDALAGALKDNPHGYRDKTIASLRKRLAENKAQLATLPDPAVEARNREADSLSSMLGSIGLGSYDQTLRDLASKRRRVIDDYAKGIKATATTTDGKAVELTQEQALARIDREISLTKKQRAEAERSLNEVEKEHYELVQDLLKGAPQLIAQTELDTRTAEGRARAYLRGNSALEAFNDEQEIAKATLPYVTALAWAQGNAHEKLANTIARVTKEKKEQLAADHALAAMQGIDQQIGSASGYMSNALADAKLALGRKQLNDWYTSTAADLAASGESWEQYHDKLDLIFGQRLASLYDEDLRNRRDWASGIIRANTELTRSNEDWASRSEGFIRGWAQAGEDAFLTFATTGKLSIGGLTDFVEQQLARMIYQRYVSKTVNSVGEGVLNAFDSAFGFSGNGTSGSSTTWGDVTSFVSGLFHEGGVAGSAAFTRNVPASAFYGARVLHTGGFASDEVPAVLKKRERVLTEDQQLKSAQMIDRWEAALNRPTIMQLPQSAGVAAASAQPARVEVHTHGEPMKVASESYDPSSNTRRIDLRRETSMAVSETVRSGDADHAISSRYGMAPLVVRRA